MKTSLLVTGATGYVGSHLIRKLTQSGFDVHIITRPNSSLSAIQDIAAKLTIHEHDGTTNGMIQLVAHAKPYMVLHLASLFLAQHTPNDIQRLIESNISFPCQLLEAMTVNQVPYLINTGTSWQHHEQQSYNPVNLYAASKQAFEDLLKYYTDTGKIKASSLLLFDTYGPQDPRGKLISLLWKTGLTQSPLAMSPGKQEIDLVHIDDVISAFECAMSILPAQQEGHTRYGISSGQPLPLKLLIERFACITGLTLPITLGARPYRPREVMATWNCYQKLPNWTPRIGLEAGIPSSRPTVD